MALFGRNQGGDPSYDWPVFRFLLLVLLLPASLVLVASERLFRWVFPKPMR